MAVIEFDTDEMQTTLNVLNEKKESVSGIIRSMISAFDIKKWKGLDRIRYTFRVKPDLERISKMEKDLSNYTENLEEARKIYQNAYDDVVSILSSLS